MSQNSTARQDSNTSQFYHVSANSNSTSDTVLEKEIQEHAEKHKDADESKDNSSSKKRSVVWQYFTPIENSDGSKATHAKCNYCPAKLSCSAKNGTSTLSRHRCPKHPLTIAENNDKRQKLISSYSKESNGRKSWKFDQEFCRKELATMIIMDEMPFSTIEHPGFRRFCKAMQPEFKLVSRITIANDCMKIYFEEKQKLVEEVSGASRVSLTTDLWTSIQTMGYMCLTAHYITNDWKLKKKIINFCMLPAPHTGEVIGQAIEDCLLSWGIEKLCCITVDNASSNDVAVRLLSRRFSNIKNGLILGGKYFHMRCAAHILNLIVKDGIDEIKSSIAAIRNAIYYVRSSPSRLQSFRKCVEKERVKSEKFICMDCPTRWNSTYLMLESAITFKQAFSRLEEEDRAYRKNIDGVGLPTEHDWNQAKVFTKFLKEFHDATEKLSGSKYTTSNLFFHRLFAIELRIRAGERSFDPSLHSMSLKMRDKYNKYWGGLHKINIMLLLGIVLDPCWKLAYIKSCYKELYGEALAENMACIVKDALNELFEQYRSEVDHVSIPFSISVGGGTVADDDGDDLVGFIKQRFKQAIRTEGIQRERTELDMYLNDPLEEEKGFVILSWWKRNTVKYPILSSIARDLLAIPTTTVASESAFSTGGRVLDKFRSSLSPTTIQALVCAQDWLRSDIDPVNVEEAFEQLQKMEQDVLEDLNKQMTGILDNSSRNVAT